jgi:hypothetical protein
MIEVALFIVFPIGCEDLVHHLKRKPRRHPAGWPSRRATMNVLFGAGTSLELKGPEPSSPKSE